MIVVFWVICGVVSGGFNFKVKIIDGILGMLDMIDGIICRVF